MRSRKELSKGGLILTSFFILFLILFGAVAVMLVFEPFTQDWSCQVHYYEEPDDIIPTGNATVQGGTCAALVKECRLQDCRVRSVGSDYFLIGLNQSRIDYFPQ